MDKLYVCKYYETPYDEGLKIIEDIGEHDKRIYNKALEDFSEKLCSILEEYQTGFNMVSMANVWHFSKEIKEELTR